MRTTFHDPRVFDSPKSTERQRGGGRIFLSFPFILISFGPRQATRLASYASNLDFGETLFGKGGLGWYFLLPSSSAPFLSFMNIEKLGGWGRRSKKLHCLVRGEKARRGWWRFTALSVDNMLEAKKTQRAEGNYLRVSSTLDEKIRKDQFFCFIILTSSMNYDKSKLQKELCTLLFIWTYFYRDWAR